MAGSSHRQNKTFQTIKALREKKSRESYLSFSSTFFALSVRRLDKENTAEMTSESKASSLPPVMPCEPVAPPPVRNGDFGPVVFGELIPAGTWWAFQPAAPCSVASYEQQIKRFESNLFLFRNNLAYNTTKYISLIYYVTSQSSP